MGELSVRDQVRLKWIKKQEESTPPKPIVIEQQGNKEERPRKRPKKSTGQIISLLSDEEPVEEIKAKNESHRIKVPKMSEPIDVTETISDEPKEPFHPFKPLHNPTYDGKHKLSNSVTIKDLLGAKNLTKTFLFSFQYSMPFILDALESKSTPITLLYQLGTVQDSVFQMDYNLNMIEVKMEPFSSHHPKLLINFYDNDKYVKIFMISANLTEHEFALNNQIVWESPRLNHKNDSISTPFKERLIDWLRSYEKPQLNQMLVRQLENYDFTPIIGDFVSSSAGVYSDFGYKSLYNILKEKDLIPTDYSTKTQLLYQSSSIGAPFSVTKEGAANLFTHLLYPMVMGGSFPIANGSLPLSRLQEQTNTELFLVFPSLEDVKSSKFGFSSGGWSHYNPYSKNGKVQHDSLLKNLFHKSHTKQRETNASHTKFMLMSRDGFKTLDWVLFTSANLSKAAWGAPRLNKKRLNDDTIKINNYETGVLISRNHFPKKANIKLVPVAIGEKKLLRNNEIAIELPFDLPPKRYDPDDVPWCISKSYDEPDSRGVLHNPT